MDRQIAHLYNTNIWFFARIVYGDFGHAFDPILNAICYVGYNLQRAKSESRPAEHGRDEDHANLNGFTQVLSFTLEITDLASTDHAKKYSLTTHLFFDDLHVYFTCSDVVVARQRNIQISFIVSKIEIDFAAIVKNVNLACINWLEACLSMPLALDAHRVQLVAWYPHLCSCMDRF